MTLGLNEVLKRNYSLLEKIRNIWTLIEKYICKSRKLITSAKYVLNGIVIKYSEFTISFVKKWYYFIERYKAAVPNRYYYSSKISSVYRK